MSHKVYKILIDDEGEKVKGKKWCLLSHGGDTDRTLCRGEAIDASTAVEFDSKTVDRGGITCIECLGIIKYYKSIKL